MSVTAPMSAPVSVPASSATDVRHAHARVSRGGRRGGALGRLRLPTDATSTPRHVADVVDGPVVFFVPARDEEPRLGAVLDRIPTVVCGRRVVTVVVDDGSSDGTADVARSRGARVVSHERGAGLGAAVRTGLRTAVEFGASAVGFCDGDGEYDPAELERLVAPILAGDADYVVGSRFAGDIKWMRPHRRWGNQLLTAWVRWTVRAPVTDGQSGFRVVSGPAARHVDIAHDYNYAQVLTIDLLARGYRYREVPISYRFRTSGRSFVRLGPYLRRVVPTVVRQVGAIHAHRTTGERRDLPVGQTATTSVHIGRHPVAADSMSHDPSATDSALIPTPPTPRGVHP